MDAYLLPSTVDFTAAASSPGARVTVPLGHSCRCTAKERLILVEGQTLRWFTEMDPRLEGDATLLLTPAGFPMADRTPIGYGTLEEIFAELKFNPADVHILYGDVVPLSNLKKPIFIPGSMVSIGDLSAAQPDPQPETHPQAIHGHDCPPAGHPFLFPWVYFDNGERYAANAYSTDAAPSSDWTAYNSTWIRGPVSCRVHRVPEGFLLSAISPRQPSDKPNILISVGFRRDLKLLNLDVSTMDQVADFLEEVTSHHEAFKDRMRQSSIGDFAGSEAFWIPRYSSIVELKPEFLTEWTVGEHRFELLLCRHGLFLLRRSHTEQGGDLLLARQWGYTPGPRAQSLLTLRWSKSLTEADLLLDPDMTRPEEV